MKKRYCLKKSLKKSRKKKPAEPLQPFLEETKEKTEPEIFAEPSLIEPVKPEVSTPEPKKAEPVAEKMPLEPVKSEASKPEPKKTEPKPTAEKIPVKPAVLKTEPKKEAVKTSKKSECRLLKDIKTKPTEDALEVAFISDGPVREYKHFYIGGSAPKLVVDLRGDWKPLVDQLIKVKSSSMARQIRVGRHPDFIRIVIDMSIKKPISALLRETPQGMTVLIKKKNKN